MMRSRRIEIFWLGLTALLLLLSVWWLPGSGDLITDSYSVSFAGRKALFRTLQQLNGNVHRSSDRLVPRPDHDDRLLILGPARNPTAKEWSELYSAVRNGSTVIFAASIRDPHVDTGPFRARVTSDFPGISVQSDNDDDHSAGENAAGDSQSGDAPGDAPSETAEPDSDSSNTATDPNPDTDADTSDRPDTDTDPSGDADTDTADTEADADEDTDGRESPSLFQLRERTARTELVDTPVRWKSSAEIEMDSDGWDVLVAVDDVPQVVRRRIGRGTFLLVASDEIFTNGALLDANRAVLAYRILEAGDPVSGATWFDETLNASGVPKVFGILFAAEFRPVTLQLLLILILFGWQGSRRFGPAESVERSRRRSIVEHAEAVGILYFRAAAGTHAVRVFREFLRLELRRLCGPGFRVDDPAAVARQAQTIESDVRDLFDALDRIEKPGVTLTRPVAARRLRQLSTLITRIRRDADAAGSS